MYIYSSDVGGDNNSTTLHVHIGLTPVTGGAALCVCVLHFKVGRCLVALMVSRVHGWRQEEVVDIQ